MPSRASSELAAHLCPYANAALCCRRSRPSGSSAISSHIRICVRTTSRYQIAGPCRTIASSRLLYRSSSGNLATRAPMPASSFPGRLLPAAAVISVQCVLVLDRDRAPACIPTSPCVLGAGAAYLGPVAPVCDCARLLPAIAVADILLRNMTVVRCSTSRVSDIEMVPLFCVLFGGLGFSRPLFGVVAR